MAQETPYQRQRLTRIAARKWRRLCRKSPGLTFRQARGLFIGQQGYSPDGLPGSPREGIDWFRLIASVPRENLR